MRKWACPLAAALAALVFAPVSCGGGNSNRGNEVATVAVTDVAMSQSAMGLAGGGVATGRLTATVQPPDATNKAVIWTSSNNYVATVSGSGLVAAGSAGTATITVTTVDGGKTATCEVTVAPPAGVFVAGSESDRATLWRDGVAQSLSANDSTATSVFVSDTDVYVAGYERFSQSGYPNYVYCAVLWKNGVAQRLSTSESYAASVFVSGADVYVAGLKYSGSGIHYFCYATLWKNDAAQQLDGRYAYSVFVSGGDVYVAGDEGSGYGNSGVLWKNAVKQRFGNGADARSVFISGGDVYVAGELGDAALWKNGVVQHLKDSASDSTRAYSVFVSGNNANDVYVAGRGYSVNVGGGGAILWKNGARQQLAPNTAYASSIFVSNNDVYVAGSNGGATLWVNGAAQRLGASSSSANAVFVK